MLCTHCNLSQRGKEDHTYLSGRTITTFLPSTPQMEAIPSSVLSQRNAPETTDPELPPTKSPSVLISLRAAAHASSSFVLTIDLSTCSWDRIYEVIPRSETSPLIHRNITTHPIPIEASIRSMSGRVLVPGAPSTLDTPSALTGSIPMTMALGR